MLSNCVRYARPEAERFARRHRDLSVRVRLTVPPDRITVSGSGGLTVDFSGVTHRVPADTPVEVTGRKETVLVRRGSSILGSTRDTVVFRSPGFIRIGERFYRGEVRAYIIMDTGLVLVNRLGLEEYLYGVLPAEIGPITPETYQAAKAQAVACRSFTINRLGKRTGLGYDLYDTYLRDQEYRGAAAEMPLGNRAVDETRGEVLFYGGGVANTLYHANCGGVTADGEQGYLVRVVDAPGHRPGARPFCATGRNYSWEVVLARDSVARTVARLRRMGSGLRIRKFALERAPGSGRVKRVRFFTDRGEVAVTGSELRFGLGLKSTLFYMKEAGKAIVFTGRGYGHGVGLCQEGALEMARRGYGYREILTHYYPRLRLSKIY